MTSNPRHSNLNASGSQPVSPTEVGTRTRRKWGQSLMEFALVAPFILLVIFGIIDLGRLMHAQATVSNAARQGARFAATGQQQRDGSGNWIPRSALIITKTKEALFGLPLVDTIYPDDFGFHRVQVNPRHAGRPGEMVEVE